MLPGMAQRQHDGAQLSGSRQRLLKGPPSALCRALSPPMQHKALPGSAPLYGVPPCACAQTAPCTCVARRGHAFCESLPAPVPNLHPLFVRAQQKCNVRMPPLPSVPARSAAFMGSAKSSDMPALQHLCRAPSIRTLHLHGLRGAPCASMSLPPPASDLLIGRPSTSAS